MTVKKINYANLQILHHFDYARTSSCVHRRRQESYMGRESLLGAIRSTTSTPEKL